MVGVECINEIAFGRFGPPGMMIGRLPVFVCAIILASVDRRLVYGRGQNVDIAPGSSVSNIARPEANSV
jgi:hypothetical protein